MSRIAPIPYRKLVRVLEIVIAFVTAGGRPAPLVPGRGLRLSPEGIGDLSDDENFLVLKILPKNT